MFNPVTGLIRFCATLTVPLPLPLPLPLLSLPLNDGGGLSSFDLRFSPRGGRNAVGDVDGVLLLVLLPDPLEEFDAKVTDVELVVGVGAPVVLEVRPARAFALALRNLLCTCWHGVDNSISEGRIETYENSTSVKFEWG